MDEQRHSREVIADAIGRAERELQAAQRAWPPDGRRVLRIRRRLDELERTALALLRTPEGCATHCDPVVNQIEGSTGGSGFWEDYEADRDVRAK
jgi:hypothetical protein